MGILNSDSRYIGKHYIWLDEIDSTNSLLRRLLSGLTTKEDEKIIESVNQNFSDVNVNSGKDLPDGFIILSDHQTLGRGRSGHSWNSPLGTSIAFSIMLRPNVKPDRIQIITLVSALAVSRAIKDTCGLDAQIKWPNDLLVNKKKVCGILTELDTTGGLMSLIVGIGININQDAFPEEISDIATSLYLETGKKIDRELLMKNFAEAFEDYYERFLQTGDMSALKKEYTDRLINLNSYVKVLDPAGSFTGIARGIDDEGKLIVEADEGKLLHVYAGEVSVRGIYGYV